MIERWKARLRAWLVELVREAIRIDRKQQEGVAGLNYQTRRSNSGTYGAINREDYGDQTTPTIPKPASKPVTAEPDFEQMQHAALQEQEKFYAPTADRL